MNVPTRTVFMAILIFGLAPPFEAGADTSISSDRQRELVNLVKHDCGSCHGLTLQGGLGPALTPQALQDRVPGYLARVISDGREGTAMPPWRDLLSVGEVEWIVQLLRRGVPDHD